MTTFQRSYVISMEFLSLRRKRLSCEMLLVVLFKTKYVQSFFKLCVLPAQGKVVLLEVT